jgi:hypothetical protein
MLEELVKTKEATLPKLLMTTIWRWKKIRRDHYLQVVAGK